MSKSVRIAATIFILIALLLGVTACSSNASTVTGIHLTGEYRNVYIVGEDFDVSGMELLVEKSDGTTSTVKLADIRDEVKILNVRTDRIADQLEIVIEYKKQRTTFKIDVVDAKSDENKVNVIFDLNIPSLSPQERVFEERKVYQLDKLEAPASMPAREGYAFDGWFKDTALKNPWNFQADKVVLTSENTNNTVYLYAKWTPYCTVTFYKITPEGDEVFVASRKIKKGDSLTDFPNIPIAPGEEKYTYEWDYSSYDSIIQDVVIYSKPPVLKTYRVEFMDYINNVPQVLYTFDNVPYGTDLLDPATRLSLPNGAQVEPWPIIRDQLRPNNRVNYVFTESWEYKGGVYSIHSADANNPLKNVTQNMQLFANYRLKTFTVTFNLNYPGAANPPAPQVVPYNTPAKNIAVDRAGYEFDGWFKEPEGRRQWDFNKEMVTSDVVLYAKWTKLNTVNYYAVYYGDAIILGQKAPALDSSSKDNFDLNGQWKDTNGNLIFAGNTMTAAQTAGDGTVYNYIKNGDTVLYTRVLIAQKTLRTGTSASNPPTTDGKVVLDGYTALWSGSATNVNEDRDIYAYYTIKTYTVRFMDGDKLICEIRDVPHNTSVLPPDSDDAAGVYRDAFTNHIAAFRQGYNFGGWSTNEYLNVIRNTDILAVFNPKPIKVTIKVTEDYVDSRDTYFDSVLSLGRPTREGYEFDGWYTTPTYLPGSEWQDNSRVNVTSKLDLYAKWVRLYTVTFMDNGQIVAKRTVREGSALTDIPAVPEIEGKNGFWREDGNEPVFSNIRRDMTLTAVYTDKIFTVYFKNGNYENYYFLSGVRYNSTVTAPASPKDPSQATPGEDIESVGFVFAGWTVAGLTGYVNFSTYLIKQDTIFIAAYTKRKFTVKFVDSEYDINGIVYDEVLVEYQGKATPPTRQPLKDGKNFIGWATDKNAERPPAVPEYNYVEGDMILYALYTDKEYKVDFKSMHDNRTWASVTVVHGRYAAYPEEAELPTNEGYTFVGWNFDFTTPITSNITIYAQWEKNQYTIIFDTRGGSPVEPILVTHGSYATPPAQPVYENMAFLGWYLDETYTQLYNFDAPVTHGFTLYARWSEYVAGYGDIVYSLNSDGSGYTVISANPEALAVKIDNFFNNKPVTSIGSGAFINNTRLQVIILPNTLQTIGANAFSGCTNLTYIEIPATVKSIGDNAFNGCVKLATVKFAENPQLTSIGNNAFMNAQKLTNLTLPDSLTTIGAGAFFNNTSLQSLTIPQRVTSIGAYAFENCSGLKYILFQRSSPASLGEGAFDGVTLSFRIYVPDTLAYGNSSDDDWRAVAARGIICPSSQISSGWYYNIITTGPHAGKLRLMHYLGNDTDVTVPTALNADGIVRTVYSMGDYLFDGKVTVFRFNSDMPLSANTFGAADNLAHLVVSIMDGPNQRELLNANITYIRNAFENIASLNELSISAVDTLRNLFGNVNPPASLKKVNILNDRTSLPANMFYNAMHIEEVTIPAAIEVIGNYAFYGCYSLTTVTIAPGSQLNHIGASAFENCVSLMHIGLPSTVNKIESDAFKATPFIANATEEFVVLGNGILYAYRGNAEIVMLPKEIRQINENAFRGASLRSFMFEEGSVLTSVGNYAFAEAVNLEHAIFPETMAAIGEGAFYNARKLAKLVLFFNSMAGSRIYIANTTNIFTGCMQSLEIYVTTSSREKFLEPDNNWEQIVRAQLGNPSWSNLFAGNLFYGDYWIYDNTTSNITLIQYYGPDKDLVIPSRIGNADVIRLANYIVPRNVRTLSFSVGVYADPKVFGALNGLTEITIRDAIPRPSGEGAADPFRMNKDYIYDMVNANKGLTTIVTGGKLSISAILGDRLPPAHITTVKIFEGETTLAREMFKDCINIINIELPSSLTEVGANAFTGSGWENAYEGDFVIILKDLDGRGLLVSYKGSDKHVVLPWEIKAINRNLFENNEFVEIITASNLLAIYDRAFAGAKALSKIIIKGNAPSFGSQVFDGLMAGSQLFVDAEKTGQYPSAAALGISVVPNNITEIGDYMLEVTGAATAVLIQYTGNRTTVEIPAFVGRYEIVSIGNHALYSVVANLTFRASDILTEYSFGNLKRLVSVTILDTNNILCGRDNIYNLVANNPGLTRIAYNGGDIKLVDLINGEQLPAHVRTVEVIPGSASIIAGMLQGCVNVTEIILPLSVKTVGLYAFENTAWYNAQPNYVVILDGYLYRYKGQESTVTIPNTVKVIGPYAFATTSNGVIWEGNNFIKAVRFQSGSAATTMLSKAFYNCSLLAKIDMPYTLTNIAVDAFEGTGMRTENNTLIATGDRGDALIKYYGTASTYELPGGINTINAEAFKGNASITKLIIPSDSLLVTIGASAFENCVNLTSVQIRRGGALEDVTTIFDLDYIEDIGADAFKGTPWFSTSAAKYIFGNGRLLLAKSAGEYIVLSDEDKPAGFELNMISSGAFASAASTKLFVNMISPLTLGIGALNTFETVYVPYDLYGMFATAWSAYGQKIAPAHVADGSFVTADGTLIYTNKTASVIALTDRHVVTRIAAGAFNGSAAVSLLITSYTPPALEGSLGSVSAIYVPAPAVNDYKAAWPAHASKITAYSQDGNLVIFGDTLYQCSDDNEVVYLPEGVRKIAGHAFAGTTKIKFIYFPASVTEVAPFAYIGLSNAVVGTGAADISNWSPDFAQNVLGIHTSLSGADLRSGDYVSKPVMGGMTIIRYLGSESFLTLPQTLSGEALYGIESKAFAGNPQLLRVIIPAGVEQIAVNAFFGSPYLTVIVLKSSQPAGYQNGWNNGVAESYFAEGAILNDASGNQFIMSGGGAVLIKAANLETMTLSFTYTIRRIAANAFAEAPALRVVRIPESVSNAGEYAFRGCRNTLVLLDAAQVPVGWAQGWSEYVLGYYTNASASAERTTADGFRVILYNNALVVVGYTGTAENVVIPNEIPFTPTSTYRVTEIAPYAFYNNTNITSVTLNADMQKISAYAFAGCTALESFTFNNNLVYIGWNAFGGTPWLNNGDWIIRQDKLYLYAASYNAAIVPDGVTSIIDGAFSTGAARFAVFMTATPPAAGSGAFAGVEAVLVPYEYLNAYKAAWPQHASVIKGYTYLDGALYYENTLVYYEGGLGELRVPEFVNGFAITEIADRAFAGHTELEKLTLPATITVMGRGVFAGCDNLIVYLLGSADTFGAGWSDGVYKVYKDISGTTLVIGGVRYYLQNNEATVIGYDESLIEVTVEAIVETFAVTAVGDGAFTGNRLFRLTLPSTVTNIAPMAFGQAPGLSLIILSNTIPDNSNGWDEGIGEIYVGQSGFINEGDYTIYAVENGAILFAFNGGSAAVEIPETIAGRQVVGIAGYAFINRAVKKIVLNEGIDPALISANAFKGTAEDCVVYARGDIDVSAYGWAASAFEVHGNYTPAATGDYIVIPDAGGLMIIGYANASVSDIEIPSVLNVGGNMRYVTGIASYAFDGVTSDLVSVRIPESVVYIGAKAFSRARTYSAANAFVEAASAPAGYANGWDDGFSDTFYDSSNSVTVNGVVYLRNNGSGAAAVGYVGETSIVTIARSVSIGGISLTVNKVASYAFANKNLAKIFIPDSVITMRDRIAYANSGNVIMSLQHNMVAANWPLGWNDFGNQPVVLSSSIMTDQQGLVMLLENGELSIVRYGGASDIVTIPAQGSVMGASYNVTAIEPYAFYNQSGLYRIYVPSSVIRIGEYAFAGCDQAVLYMGHAGRNPDWDYAGATVAFDADIKFTYYGYDDYVTVNGFLYKLDTANNKAHIVDYVGADSEVDIPAGFNSDGKAYGVVSIGVYAFAFRTDIRKIYIPKEITDVHADAFMGSYNAVINLEHTVMPSWPEGWSRDALSVNVNANEIYGTSIQYLLSPSTMEATVIGHIQSNVTSLEIPDTITVTVTENEVSTEYVYTVTRIAEYAFYRNTSLTTVQLPANLTEIGAYAFYGCALLAVLNNFGSSIVNIGENALTGTLWYSRLTGDFVQVGNSIRLYRGYETAVVFDSQRFTGIMGGAFASADAVDYVIFRDGMLPEVNENAFDGISKVLVPAAYLNMYQTAWGHFADIDAFTEVNGMIFYRGALLAIVNGTDTALTVPAEAGGYAVDTIAAYVSKTTRPTFTSLTVPETVKAIGPNSFPYTVIFYEAASRPAGYSPDMGALQEYFGLGSFFTAEGGLFAAVNGNRAALIRYEGMASEYTIPQSVTHNGVTYTVTAVSAYAFAYNNNIRSVYLPAGIANVNRYAFRAEGGEPAFIIYTALPEGSYEWYAGWERPVYFGVSTVHTQGALRYIIAGGEITITQYLGEAQSLNIPQTITVGSATYPVTVIGKYAFYGLTRLESVTIPSGVRYIGKHAFTGTAWAASQIFVVDNGRLLLYNGDETEVTLDESLGIRSIVGGAFLSGGAARVNITGTTPMIELYDGAFDGIELISVPEVALDVYRDYIWTAYGSIIA